LKRELLKERDTFHLDIPADENNLSEVRDFISEICMQAGFSKRETNNTKLAMDEACTNIIKHAYGNMGGEIRIDVQAEPGKVEINIFDSGEAFDWSKIEDPDLQEYVEIGKKGGLGIFLMNRLMDDLNYKSSTTGNHLYMMKSIEGGKRPIFISAKPRWTSTLRFKFGLRSGLGLLGLVLFLWTMQFVNQTREINAQRNQIWVTMVNFARTLETKSESALVIDDLFDPEYRKVTDFVVEQLDKIPAVMYARIVNNEGQIVSSSDIDELFGTYEIPQEVSSVNQDGEWRITRDDNEGTVKEFHLPIALSSEEGDRVAVLGRVIIGISEKAVNSSIYDPRPRTAFLLAGIFIVGVSLIYLLISVLVKPIQALTDGVRAIGEGSLDDEIKIEGPEEIGEIARAFNEITSKFRDAQKSVVEQERMQKEMQVAQEIQHSLLPKKVPKISGYDIGSMYRAAKEVGGDYFDFVNVDEDTLGVVVADVSGKGVPGSLVMTMIRTALRMEARGNLSAAEVMARMNDFVTEDMKKGMFVTIFYVILDSKNRIISYASAGHNPMILYRAETDETFFLNPRGFPVGISLPDDTLFRRSIDVEKIKLKKDDMLLIYTDGVTEAMNVHREQYGEDRLINLIKRHGRSSPEEFVEKLNEDVKEFTGDFPQNDDITVVAIKEKLMADDVLFGIRKRLLDLVDIEGFSVAEACRRMKVSPSTYYRYKKRLLELGERGLKNKMLRQEHAIKRVSLEQRKEILRIIKDNPKYGAKRISNIFNNGKDDNDALSPTLIYDELKRMRLNTYEKRLEYLRRNKIITEEQFDSMLLSPSSKARPETVEAAGVDGALEAEPTWEAAAAGAVEPIEPEPEPEMAVRPGARSEEAIQPFMFQQEEAGNVEIKFEDLGEGVVVLNVKGHLDSSSAGELEGVLESIYDYGFRKIIVDLKEVSYISSGGWGIFTGRVKTLRDGEGDVVLVGMSSEVYDIYELLGFQDIIMHFHAVRDAVDFVSLPFEVRQRRLEEMVRKRMEPAVIEHRISEVEAEITDLGEEEVSPWTPLKIEAGTVGKSGEVTVLYLDGVIDTVSCSKLRTIFDDLVEKGNKKLVIDMSRVEYVSSSGWGVFASRIDDIRRLGGDIKIFGMDQEVDNIFHLLGFDVIMRSFSILAEAIGDFERPAPAMGDGIFTDGEIIDAGDVRHRPAETGVTEEESGAEDRESAGRSIDGAVRDFTLSFAGRRIDAAGEEAFILSIEGALDASTTEELEVRLGSYEHEDVQNLIIDLSGVIYISSSGWGMILKYVQRFEKLGRKMALAGMSAAIFKIFRDLGFEPLVPNYISAEKAVEELVSPEARLSEAGTDRRGATAIQNEAKEAVDTDEASTGGKDEVARPVGEVEKTTPLPRVEKPDLEILERTPLEKDEEKVIFIDFNSKKDMKEDKDKRIRKIGWSEYGKKLSKKNKDNKKRKS
jgi:anti-anti-sigma factor